MRIKQKVDKFALLCVFDLKHLLSISLGRSHLNYLLFALCEWACEIFRQYNFNQNIAFAMPESRANHPRTFIRAQLLEKWKIPLFRMCFLAGRLFSFLLNPTKSDGIAMN